MQIWDHIVPFISCIFNSLKMTVSVSSAPKDFTSFCYILYMLTKKVSQRKRNHWILLYLGGELLSVFTFLTYQASVNRQAKHLTFEESEFSFFSWPGGVALIVEPDQYTEGVPVVIIWRADLFVVFFSGCKARMI